MNGNRLTVAADRAGQRYKALLLTFENVVKDIIYEADPGYPSVRKRAKKNAYDLARTYLEDEVIHVEQSIAQEIRDAVSTTLELMGKSYAEPIHQVDLNAANLAEELDQNVRTQLERDIISVDKTLREFSIRSLLISKGRKIAKKDALAWLRTNTTVNPKFDFMDRAGRSWASEKYIRGVYRHTLLLTWNYSAMLTMAARGVSEARIAYPDETHEYHGTVISLAEEGTMITWDQVKDDVFHPNSSAYIIPNV